MAERPTPPPYRPDFPLWMRAAVLSVPLAFFALGLGLTAQTISFLGDSSRAIGQIVSIRIEQRTRRNLDGFSETVVTEWPTVRYAGPDGDWREREVAIALGFGDRAVGDRVWVRYDNVAPERVRLDRGFWDHWLGAIAFTTMGGALSLGLILLFRHFERMNRARYRAQHGIDPE